MKKCVAVILALSVLLTVFGSLADTLDYSVLKNNGLIDVEIEDSGNAFVNSIVGETVFRHENTIEEYPSYVYSDIIIGDYYSTSPVAFWRFWVSYSAARYLGITSISFVFDGKQYTFNNVGSKDNMKSYETNVRENSRIIFGMNNFSFWSAFLLKYESYATRTDMIDDCPVQMILHGTTKDVTIDLDGWALMDLAVVGEVYLSLAGVSALIDEEGTEMTVVDLETTGM